MIDLPGWLTAVGTIAVALVAIWGDWFRFKFAPVKLELNLLDVGGELTSFGSTPGLTIPTSRRVYFYHLRVVNKRRWNSPKNCRVLLKAIAKRGPDGHFHSVPLAVPLQFVWAPSEFTPPVISIEDESILDFGRLAEVSSQFEPVLYGYSNSFSGYVKKDEALRYSLQILADGFIAKRYQVFEVAWDGKWDADREKMRSHLVIKEILP